MFGKLRKRSPARRKEKEPEKINQMAANAESQQNPAGRHQEVGHKSLLQSDALYQVGRRSFLPAIGLSSTADLGSISWLGFVSFVVYTGDQCLPKRARAHEGAQGVDCQAPMVGLLPGFVSWMLMWNVPSLNDLLLVIGSRGLVWLKWVGIETGTWWPHRLMKGSSWTCFSSSSMPRTPWRSGFTPATLSSPPPSLFPTTERSDQRLNFSAALTWVMKQM